MKEKLTCTELLLALLLVAIIVPLSMLSRAWMLTVLWNMFIIPQFELAPLTYYSALGLSLIIGVLTHTDLSDVVKEPVSNYWNNLINKTLTALLYPVMIVGFAKLIALIFG